MKLVHNLIKGLVVANIIHSILFPFMEKNLVYISNCYNECLKPITFTNVSILNKPMSMSGSLLISDDILWFHLTGYTKNDGAILLCRGYGPGRLCICCVYRAGKEKVSMIVLQL